MSWHRLVPCKTPRNAVWEICRRCGLVFAERNGVRFGNSNGWFPFAEFKKRFTTVNFVTEKCGAICEIHCGAVLKYFCGLISLKWNSRRQTRKFTIMLLIQKSNLNKSNMFWITAKQAHKKMNRCRIFSSVFRNFKKSNIYLHHVQRKCVLLWYCPEIHDF